MEMNIQGNRSTTGILDWLNAQTSNTGPVAVADTATVAEDASLTSTNVITNDTDVDGDTLTLTAVSTSGTGTVGVNVDGVSVDYTPAADFNGTEEITYTVSDGTDSDATGTLTITVTAVNDDPTGSVTISGTATQGETLTASNTLADADGLGTITYTWSNSATGSSITLGQGDVGNTITVTASYTDDQGTSESVASSATSAVANVNDDPTGSVTISGTATQGETLTASNTLADADGLGTITYTWSNECHRIFNYLRTR